MRQIVRGKRLALCLSCLTAFMLSFSVLTPVMAATDAADADFSQIYKERMEKRAKKKAEAEAKKKAEEEAKKKAEEEAKRKADAEAKKKEEAEAKRKADAKKKSDNAAARKRAEAAAKKKADEEAARKKAEEEAQKRAQEEEVIKKANAYPWHPSAKCQVTDWKFKSGDRAVIFTILYRKSGTTEEVRAPRKTTGGDTYFLIEKVPEDLQVVLPGDPDERIWAINCDVRKGHVYKIEDIHDIPNSALDDNANKDAYGGKTFKSGEAAILHDSGMTIRPPVL